MIHVPQQPIAAPVLKASTWFQIVIQLSVLLHALQANSRMLPVHVSTVELAVTFAQMQQPVLHAQQDSVYQEVAVFHVMLQTVLAALLLTYVLLAKQDLR